MTASVNADRVFHREIGRDYPMVDRGEGIYVFDSAGRRYIDGAGGVFFLRSASATGSPVESALSPVLLSLVLRRNESCGVR